MGAALSIFVILSLSVFVVRVASVALRFTGLTDSSARFQALSAFTGTGFTTSEAETVVNYPVRRRIIGILMIIGNMGFVTVFAALVVSLVQTDGELGAVVTQITWLVGGMALLWALMLNNKADRILCSAIGKILESTTLSADNTIVLFGPDTAHDALSSESGQT
jgi:Trk-type K+ transport system membrane component